MLKAQSANEVSMDATVGGKHMLGAMDNLTQVKSNGDAILQMAIDGTAVDPVQRSMEANRLELLPPYNVDATSPSDVYDIKNLINEDAWGQISRVVSACGHKDNWRESLMNKDRGDEWPVSLKREIMAACGGGELSGCGDEEKDKVKMLCFLRHMVVFHNAQKG